MCICFRIRTHKLNEYIHHCECVCISMYLYKYVIVYALLVHINLKYPQVLTYIYMYRKHTYICIQTYIYTYTNRPSGLELREASYPVIAYQEWDKLYFQQYCIYLSMLFNSLCVYMRAYDSKTGNLCVNMSKMTIDAFNIIVSENTISSNNIVDHCYLIKAYSLEALNQFWVQIPHCSSGILGLNFILSFCCAP